MIEINIIFYTIMYPKVTPGNDFNRKYIQQTLTGINLLNPEIPFLLNEHYTSLFELKNNTDPFMFNFHDWLAARKYTFVKEL